MLMIKPIIAVLFGLFVEDVYHVEVLPQFTSEVVPQGLDEAVALEGDSAHSLCPALEVLRMVNHILLEHLNKSAASINDDGLVLPLGSFDIGEKLFVCLADGCVFTEGRINSRDPLVKVHKKRVWGRKSKSCFPSSRQTADDHNDILVGEIHVLRLHNGHRQILS